MTHTSPFLSRPFADVQFCRSFLHSENVRKCQSITIPFYLRNSKFNPYRVGYILVLWTKTCFSPYGYVFTVCICQYIGVFCLLKKLTNCVLFLFHFFFPKKTVFLPTCCKFGMCLNEHISNLYLNQGGPWITLVNTWKINPGHGWPCRSFSEGWGPSSRGSFLVCFAFSEDHTTCYILILTPMYFRMYFREVKIDAG